MQEFKTTDTGVGTGKWHAAPHGLPTTHRRQGAKSLSLGKLFPQPAPSATQQGEPLPQMGSAARRHEGASLSQGFLTPAMVSPRL